MIYTVEKPTRSSYTGCMFDQQLHRFSSSAGKTDAGKQVLSYLVQTVGMVILCCPVPNISREHVGPGNKDTLWICNIRRASVACFTIRYFGWVPMAAGTDLP